MLNLSGLFMWKRRSGGTGSGPVGDVVGSVVAQKYFPEEVTLTQPQRPTPSFHRQPTKGTKASSSESQWHSHSFHHQSLSSRSRNIGPPRRCDSSELADSPIRTEAIKVRIYNPVYSIFFPTIPTLQFSFIIRLD